jgi:hypothetical protein
MHELADDYLVKRIGDKLKFVSMAGAVLDDDELLVIVNPIDMRRVASELSDNYAKQGSSREIQLLTTEYRPQAAFSSAIVGSGVQIGPATFGPSAYWDEIEFACGSWWRCDAPRSIERKARDIRKHLAQAVRQLQGDVPSAVHVGLETHDGELVEAERYRRIFQTVSEFDSQGTNLDWIYCHFLGPESPPDNTWDFAETTLLHPRDAREQPLDDRFLVVPHENVVSNGDHWSRK